MKKLLGIILIILFALPVYGAQGYVDAIIELNNGLAPLIGEFLMDADVRGLVEKDKEGNPIAIKIRNFPKETDVYKKRLVCIRVTKAEADALLAKKFFNKRILVMAPSGTDLHALIASAPEEDEDLGEYTFVGGNALRDYQKYYRYPESIPDIHWKPSEKLEEIEADRPMIPNPKLYKDVYDEDGEWVDSERIVPEPIKKMGRWM